MQHSLAMLVIMLSACCLVSCTPASFIRSVRISGDSRITASVELANSSRSISLALYDISNPAMSSNMSLITPSFIRRQSYAAEGSGTYTLDFDSGGLDRNKLYLLVAADDHRIIGSRVLSHYWLNWHANDGLVLDTGGSLKFSFPEVISAYSPAGANEAATLPDRQHVCTQEPATLQPWERGSRSGRHGSSGNQVAGPPEFKEVFAVEAGRYSSFQLLEYGIRSSELKRLFFTACHPGTRASLDTADGRYWRDRAGENNDILVIINTDLSLQNDNAVIREAVRYRIDDNGNMSEVPIPGAPQK